MAPTWREYISLDQELGDYTTQVSLALDRLFQTPEGRELIEKAFRVSNVYGTAGKIHMGTASAEPLHIADLILDPKDYGTYAFTSASRIRLDFDEISHAVFDAQGRQRNGDIVESVIHELYHLADGNNVWGGRQFSEAIALHSVNAPGLDDNQRKQIFTTAFREIIHNSMDRDMTLDELESLSSNTALKNRIATQLQLPPDSFTLNNVTDALMKEMERRYFRIDPQTGYREIEEDAVDYTDALMAKYFNTVPRGQYSNGQIIAQSFGIIVPKLQCSSMPMPRYEWEEVMTDHGIFVQPTIHAIPCRQVLDSVPNR